MRSTTLDDLTFRLAQTADTRQTSRVYKLAMNDLYRRQGVPPYEEPDHAWAPLHRHFLRHDGERFWVAQQGGTVAGFAVGVVRGHWWFLGSLFVHPEFQGRGIGRAIMERAFAGYPRPGGIAAAMTDAAQPVSNTLYARHGMLPRLALLLFTGAPPADVRFHLPKAIEVIPLDVHSVAELRDIDLAVTGIDRTPDHHWFFAHRSRRGWLFRRAGVPIGYVYVAQSGVIGPAAAVCAADMAPLMRFALAEAARGRIALVEIIVPAANTHAQQVLWAAGLVLDPSTGLLLASRSFGRFDRYVCGSYGLM